MQLIVAVICAAAIEGLAGAQRAVPGTPAVPIEPIAGILEMFKTHDVVALSEGSHGNEQGHAFRLALIRDPRFSATVNDIVVEFGNALYQDVIDRFVQGEQVAYEDLRKVWQDTTQRGTVWDRPIYEAFYRAVRDVNATLPIARRLRVSWGIRRLTGRTHRVVALVGRMIFPSPSFSGRSWRRTAGPW